MVKKVLSIAIATLAALALAPATRGQSSPGTQLVIQMREWTRRLGHTFGWGISSDTVNGPYREKYDRRFVRFVSARVAIGDKQRECDKAFSTLQGAEDIVVWKDRSHTGGRIEGVGCHYDDCESTQNGITRPWDDVDYVQLATALRCRSSRGLWLLKASRIDREWLTKRN